jgi:hypothetical protein
VTPTASLPMYNLPEMRAVNARFWEALRGLLLEAGLRDLPEGLSYERPPVPDRIGPEVLFSQTCGYPLETIFAAQAARLGTPCYAVPGCDGPTHCGLFIVPAASRAEELRDLQGGMFLFNQPSAFEFGDEPAAARPGGYRRRPAAVRKRCPQPDPKRPSKQDVVIAMLRQPEGASGIL